MCMPRGATILDLVEVALIGVVRIICLLFGPVFAHHTSR